VSNGWKKEHVNEKYWNCLERLLAELRIHDIVGRFDVAGSFRRGEETVGDLDVVVESHEEDRKKLSEELADWELCDELLGPSDGIMMIRTDEIQIDFDLVEPESYGSFLHRSTGNWRHYEELREYARSEGYEIDDYGVYEIDGYDDSGKPIKGEKIGGSEEKDVYDILGLPVPEPEDRYGGWLDRHTDGKQG